MKHLLLEIEVSDKGQAQSNRVGELIEDALQGHMRMCIGSETEKSYFVSSLPRVRVLTEDDPL